MSEKRTELDVAQMLKDGALDGITLHLRMCFPFRDGRLDTAWAAYLERPRLSPATGRKLKPEHLMTLVSDDGPVGVLRDLAKLIEESPVKFKEPDDDN